MNESETFELEYLNSYAVTLIGGEWQAIVVTLQGAATRYLLMGDKESYESVMETCQRIIDCLETQAVA